MRLQHATRPDLEFEEVKTGFAVGKAAAMAEWSFRKEKRDFAVIVKRLLNKRYFANPRVAVENRRRSRAWALANPGKRKVIANRYAAKPAVRQRQLAQQKARLAAKRRSEGKVFVCKLEGCGAEFCRLPGIRGMGMHPGFCMPTHYSQWYYRHKRTEAQRTEILKKQREQYAASLDAPKAWRGVLHCSKCGGTGHNRRRCFAGVAA